jgi:hypothetical protein
LFNCYLEDIFYKFIKTLEVDLKSKLYMALALCASFVGMTHAKLEAVSTVPPLLVVSCVRGAINSVTLSTNTIATALDVSIGDTGTDHQLIGLVEFNATKQVADPQALQIVQIVQVPVDQPEGNHFPAFGEACGSQVTGSTDTNWQAIEIWSNVDPANATAAAVYTNSTVLTRTTVGGSYGATLMQSNAGTYCGQTGILTFYAVDDIDNSVIDGTYRAYFMITFQ